jgi:Skp family chaperone for outer membrane proteins
MKEAFKVSVYFFIVTIFFASYSVAEFRIATVNVNRLLNESKEATAKKKELDELSAKAKKKVDEKKKELQAIEQKIKDGQVKEDSTEAQNFRNEARDFARFVKDTESDLRTEFLKSNRTLTEKAINMVAKYAADNSIDLVLDKSEAGRSPVIYGATTFDITDAIVKQVNQ